MDAEKRVAFTNAVTKYIFTKNGKLSLFPLGSDAMMSLQDIQNLNVQLETIQRHVFLYDIDDVFNIVTPVDLTMNALTGQVRNLFVDYQTLHVTQVANSNAWWNRYAKDDYVRENMMYGSTLLKNDMPDDLWNRCSDDYDVFNV